MFMQGAKPSTNTNLEQIQMTSAGDPGCRYSLLVVTPHYRETQEEHLVVSHR